MAHFTITLPGNLQADVRTGKIRKIGLHILQLLKLKPLVKEVNTGYIVKVAAVGDNLEYHLMKDKEGKWLKSDEHHWLREGDGQISVAIQQAIDAHERG